MQTQFSHTHARTTDPFTSHEAAEQALSLSDRHRWIILAALKEYGAMSKDEIANVTDLNGIQIARRLPDLEKANLARPTGETRTSESGRQERVWECV